MLCEAFSERHPGTSIAAASVAEEEMQKEGFDLPCGAGRVAALTCPRHVIHYRSRSNPPGNQKEQPILADELLFLAQKEGFELRAEHLTYFFSYQKDHFKKKTAFSCTCQSLQFRCVRPVKGQIMGIKNDTASKRSDMKSCDLKLSSFPFA